MHSIDIVAALVAALGSFVVGGLWYGSLFQKPWMRHSGVTPERGEAQNKALVFGLAYLLNYIAAAGLSMLMGDHSGWGVGLHTGLLTGVFFVAPALGVIYLFEARSFVHWLLNAGYQVVTFGLMGTIVGAWPW